MNNVGSSNFISQAISNTCKLIRLIFLLSAIVIGLIFLIRSIIQCLQPEKLGIKMIEAQNTRLYFESSDNNLEILRLPANLFWVQSDTRLGENKELCIRASGMVSIGFSNHVKSIIKDVIGTNDTFYIDFALEFERYLTTDWRDPDGNSIMHLNNVRQTKCRKYLNNVSNGLKLYKDGKYGSIVGFVFSKEPQRIIEKFENENEIEKKIHFIDSMIAYKRNSILMEVFYVGKGVEICEKGLYYIIKRPEVGRPIYLSKYNFNGSKIYFAVNDAVLSNINDIVIPDSVNCSEEEKKYRQKHKDLFTVYSRHHSLWYLDNSGDVNIFILSK